MREGYPIIHLYPRDVSEPRDTIERCQVTQEGSELTSAIVNYSPCSLPKYGNGNPESWLGFEPAPQQRRSMTPVQGTGFIAAQDSRDFEQTVA